MTPAADRSAKYRARLLRQRDKRGAALEAIRDLAKVVQGSTLASPARELVLVKIAKLAEEGMRDETE